MYGRGHWLGGFVCCEVEQTAPTEVDVRVQVVWLVGYHADLAGLDGHGVTRRRAHDGLQDVQRVWKVQRDGAVGAPALGAIGGVGGRGQARGGGERGDERQRGGARVQTRSQGQGRGAVSRIQSARRWGGRVATRRRRARGRRVRRQTVEAPHAAYGRMLVCEQMYI